MPGRSRRRGWTLRGEAVEPRLAMAAGPLVITELMYDPPAVTAAEDTAGFKRDDFEFVELQNISGQPLDLAGFKLTEGITFTFGAGTLAPNERVVVVPDTAAFTGAMELEGVAGEYAGTLGDEDDRVVFSSPAGSKILDFTYSEDWHPTTAGDGFSLVIVDPNGNASQWNQPQGWRPSNIIGGTPGTAEGSTDVTPPSVSGPFCRRGQRNTSFLAMASSNRR